MGVIWVGNELDRACYEDRLKLYIFIEEGEEVNRRRGRVDKVILIPFKVFFSRQDRLGLREGVRAG